MALLQYRIYNKSYYPINTGTRAHEPDQIRPIGRSQGVIIPKAILDKLGLSEGDVLHVTQTATGIGLTPYDPNFDAQMEAFESGMSKYPNALRELAKEDYE